MTRSWWTKYFFFDGASHQRVVVLVLIVGVDWALLFSESFHPFSVFRKVRIVGECFPTFPTAEVTSDADLVVREVDCANLARSAVMFFIFGVAGI